MKLSLKSNSNNRYRRAFSALRFPSSARTLHGTHSCLTSQSIGPGRSGGALLCGRSIASLPLQVQARPLIGGVRLHCKEIIEVSLRGELPPGLCCLRGEHGGSGKTVQGPGGFGTYGSPAREMRVNGSSGKRKAFPLPTLCSVSPGVISGAQPNKAVQGTRPRKARVSFEGALALRIPSQKRLAPDCRR